MGLKPKRLVVFMHALENVILYTFREPELLVEALTHSSFGHEHSCPYNERLEFLGDSILGYVISEELYSTFPKLDEGILSKLKSVLVSSNILAEKAIWLCLGQYLRLGKGEVKAGGDKKPSILADAMEALIGAISLDGGLEMGRRFILVLYEDDVLNASLELKNSIDFKTLLQEKLQKYGLKLPTYSVAREDGPAHNRRFQVKVCVADYQGPSGMGSSKKNAQQDSARQLLKDEHFWKEYVPGLFLKSF